MAGSIKYRTDIDGMRAIGVLLGLVFHFNLFSIGKAGFMGVDIFFVISGYLMTGIIFTRIQKENFSLFSLSFSFFWH